MQFPKVKNISLYKSQPLLVDLKVDVVSQMALPWNIQLTPLNPQMQNTDPTL